MAYDKKITARQTEHAIDLLDMSPSLPDTTKPVQA